MPEHELGVCRAKHAHRIKYDDGSRFICHEWFLPNAQLKDSQVGIRAIECLLWVESGHWHRFPTWLQREILLPGPTEN